MLYIIVNIYSKPIGLSSLPFGATPSATTGLTLPAFGTPQIPQSTSGPQLGTTPTFTFGSGITATTTASTTLPSFGSVLGSQSSGSQMGTTSSSLTFGPSTGTSTLPAFGSTNVAQTTTSSQMGGAQASLPNSGIPFGTTSTLQGKSFSVA